MDARSSNYDIATGHLDSAVPIDSGSFDSSRTTRAQVHALLAIADEVRNLRVETANVATAVRDLGSATGRLGHLVAYLEKLAGKQPD
jgi:hypothetical protein